MSLETDDPVRQVSALERAVALLDPAARPSRLDAPEGYLDLLGSEEVQSTGTAQDLMLSRMVPQIYERWWRPALGRLAKGVLGPGMSGERQIVRQLLSLSPGQRVLDIACGPGNFSREFARAIGPEGLVVGIDVSPTMLARAAQETRAARIDQLALVRGDAQELPFRDAAFDGICCFAALHLFADPFRALDRMTSVLARGGRIAIFTSVGGRSPLLRPGEALVGRASGMRLFGVDEITGALERRGFGDIQQRLAGATQFVGGRLP